MDKLDAALWAAWDDAREALTRDPREFRRRFERGLRPTLARPLRAWAMVLRAEDKRIDDLADEMKYRKASGALFLDRDVVGRLCSPVRIEYPGLHPAKAARALGVSEATVYDWSSPAKTKKTGLVMDRYTKPWLMPNLFQSLPAACGLAPRMERAKGGKGQGPSGRERAKG